MFEALFETTKPVVQFVSGADQQFDSLLDRSQATFDTGESVFNAGEPGIHVRDHHYEYQAVEKHRRSDSKPELLVSHIDLLQYIRL